MLTEEQRKRILFTLEDFFRVAKPCEPILTEQDIIEMEEEFQRMDMKRAQDWTYLSNRVVGYDCAA